MRLIRIVLWLAFWTYSVLLFVLTHIPHVPTVSPWEAEDKLKHFLAYAVLAGLMYLAMWASLPFQRRIGTTVLVAVLLFGAVDEITQPLVGRSGELADWIADALGALVGVGILFVLRKRAAAWIAQGIA